jgi:hypothetical protein
VVPLALRFTFDDAMNKLILDREISATSTLLRFHDLITVRKICWPDATLLEDRAQDALFLDIVRRAHTDSGLQLQMMMTARSDAGLDDIDALSRAAIADALHKIILLCPRTWTKSKGAAGAVGWTPVATAAPHAPGERGVGCGRGGGHGRGRGGGRGSGASSGAGLAVPAPAATFGRSSCTHRHAAHYSTGRNVTMRLL